MKIVCFIKFVVSIRIVLIIVVIGSNVLYKELISFCEIWGVIKLINLIFLVKVIVFLIKVVLSNNMNMCDFVKGILSFIVILFFSFCVFKCLVVINDIIVKMRIYGVSIIIFC